ncbi:DHA2 family efflux MFS transporter permease subunit [bacterium]|nr:MAG: DHA2 family efflux MFS transporter permease subunit [bacterium]
MGLGALGGYLTTNFSWPMIFFVNLPFGIAAVFLAQTFLPADSEIKQTVKKVDWAGIGLLIVGLGSLQWMLEDGNSEDWFESGEITALAILAVVGLGLFVWRELTAKEPAVDLRVLRHRQLAAGSAFNAVLGMGLFGATFALPIFTQSVLSYTAEQTGTLMLPGALASAMMMPVMGKLVNKYDARLLVTIGALVFVATMFALQGINPQTSRDSFFWPLIGRGIGISLMFMPLTTASLGSLPKQDLASASAFTNLARQMGGSIGIAVLATMLARREAFHRATLLEHVSALDPQFQIRFQALVQGFMQKGADLATAQQRAYAAIDRTVSVQAAVISFGDVFHIVGWAFLIALPLVLLLGKGGRPVADAH